MPALLLLLTALEHDELDVDGLERRPEVDDARRLARGGGRGHREGVWFRFSKEENVTTSHFSRRFFSFGVFESQEKKRSVFLSLYFNVYLALSLTLSVSLLDIFSVFSLSLSVSAFFSGCLLVYLSVSLCLSLTIQLFFYSFKISHSIFLLSLSFPCFIFLYLC